MSKRLIIALLVVVFVALSVEPVSAQLPSSYSSTVNVTDVTGSGGVITLTFYDLNGDIIDEIEDTISGYETKWYKTLPISSGFDGSMVISSSVQLASMSIIQAKNSSGNPMSYAGYIGTSSGSTEVFLPLLMSRNFGYHTYFYVQNTSSTPVNIDIEYSDGTSRTINNLPPNTSAKIDNRLEDHPATYFSGRLTANGQIAAAVVGYSDGRYGKQLYSYTGFSSGALFPFFTIINQLNYGYWTGISLQNMGDVETTVTLEYTPVLSGQACFETQTIPPREERLFGNYTFVYSKPSDYPPIESDCRRGRTFIGTAVVTVNTNNQPLVGIINQLNLSLDPNKGAALMTQDPTSASDTIVFPYVQQWDGSWNWWTGWTVINASGGSLPAGDIECRVVGSSPSGPVNTVLSNPSQLGNGEGWYHLFYRNTAPLPNGFTGGAVCVSQSGGNILGSMNILAAGASTAIDSKATYEAINPYLP